MRLALVAVLVAAGLAGCAPDYGNGTLACAPASEKRCPDGYHCAADDRCWQDGSGPDLGATTPDAAPTNDLALVGDAALRRDGGTPVDLAPPGDATTCFGPALDGGVAQLATPALYSAAPDGGIANPEFPTLANLDNKNGQDLVIGDFGTSKVRVLLRNSDGSFGPPQVLAGGGTRMVAVADITGDSAVDIVSPGFQHCASGTTGCPVYLYKNDGTGHFTALPTLTTSGDPAWVELADVDGDGHRDAAIALCASNQVAVLLGDGMGGFGSPSLFAADTTTCELAAGDLDHDGKVDLVAANEGANDLTVLLNVSSVGAPNFKPSTVRLGDQPHYVIVRDLDGDCAPDLVAALPFLHQIAIARGHGDGTFATPVTVNLSDRFYAVAAADFNRDGLLDLAVAANGNAKAAVLFGQGGLLFGATQTYTLPSPTKGVAVTDIDRNGWADFAVTYYSSPDGVAVFMNH